MFARCGLVFALLFMANAQGALAPQREKKVSDKSTEEIICVICREDINSNTDKGNITTTPCMHVFHKDCLRSALLIKKECPLCRTNFNQHQNFLNGFHLPEEETTQDGQLSEEARSFVIQSLILASHLFDDDDTEEKPITLINNHTGKRCHAHQIDDGSIRFQYQTWSQSELKALGWHVVPN